MSRTNQVKKALRRKKKKIDNTVREADLLSTGSTLVNLACTGRIRGGLAKGKYHFFVGDSASGKTFLALTCFAEANLNKNFKGYRLIYDNAEDGALMDWSHYFGEETAGRIEAPAYDGGDADSPVYSETIEEFFDHLDDAVDAGKPFIYILDSMDALTSHDETKKANEQRDARRKGKEAAGSYGDGKAKKNSANLRRFLKPLRQTGSILVIINQTRDNLGFGFEKKSRSGGHALRFYATLEIWSSIVKKLRKEVAGANRSQGIIAKVEVKKNRFTGRLHSVELPIYHQSGIDDVGSCVDFLIEVGHWKKKRKSSKPANGKKGGGTIAPQEFEFEGSRERLIRFIEDNDLEDDLRDIVGRKWKEIEDACVIKRKKRYV